MRVLILSNMYPSVQKPYSGIFVENQIRWLKDRGEQDLTVDVRAMRRRFTGPIGSFFKYGRFLISTLPQFFVRYDVVHLHFFTPLGIWVWLYKKLYRRSCVVVTFHGSDVCGPQCEGIAGRFWRNLSKVIDVGIAVGPDVESIVVNRLLCSRTVLLPAGVDESVFYPEAGVLKEFDFIFVGSLTEGKGIDLIVEGIAAGDITGRWCIVGNGPYQARMQELQRDGKLTYLGALNQDQIRTALNQSKWLVIPSRREGFGLVASEALYCGTPVICSHERGLRLQVSDGENGLVVRAGDYASLCKILAKALSISNEEYRRFSRAAIGSNREFSAAAVGDRLLRIYRENASVGA